MVESFLSTAMTNQTSKAVLHHLCGAIDLPPLLLIHGFGADRLSWSIVGPNFEKTHSVWAIDLPGHGAAGNDVGSGSIELLYQAVKEEVMAQIIGPISIIGHSLGGAIARLLAEDSDVDVRKLVMLAPGGFLPLGDPSFVSDFSALKNVEDVLRHLRKAVANERTISPAMADYVLSSLEKPGRRIALSKIAEYAVNPPKRSEIKHDNVTCIWGEDDTIIKLDQDQLARVIPDLHILPRVGHLPHLEATQKVCRIVQAAIG